jgi:putative nucleotidyltransferase with HDIG domain
VTRPSRRSLLIGANAALLAAALAGAALTSRMEDWEPAGLVGLLAALAVFSDSAAITAKGQRLSGAFIALVLAMALLGPAPATVLGVLVMVVDSARGPRPSAPLVLNNLATYAAFPLVGGLLVRAVEHAGAGRTAFAFAVAGIYLLTNVLNFVLIAWGRQVFAGHSMVTQAQTILRPLVPSEIAAATLVLAFTLAYAEAGFWALTVLVVALLGFQMLTRELLVSQERAEQIAARSTELATLQVGVLAALVQTLSLRDKMTARHSAAVARYARAMARACGCSEAEQDLVHTAALLHDLGKFIFPDRILFADNRLSEDDWEIVRRHPGQGARVVGRVAGYGPVAEIIYSHHERVDGDGYPNGLRGEAIPRLSRMISIADTYDVMTARDSYRSPVSPQEAIAELRRVSGSQLDGELVEVFVRVLEESGVSFQHTTDADFERELNFEARVAAFLQAPVARA